jgi:hypothetical protein
MADALDTRNRGLSEIIAGLVVNAIQDGERRGVCPFLAVPASTFINFTPN